MAAGDFSAKSPDGRASPAGRVRLDPGQAARFCSSASSVGGLPGPDRPGRTDTERAGRGPRSRVRPAETGRDVGRRRAARQGREDSGEPCSPRVCSFVLCVNARAVRPCPKAPGGTAKRRVQAQQKSAWRYSKNLKRRLKAQQKSAYRYSRSWQRRVQVQQKAPASAFLTSVGTAPTGADKNRTLPKRTWRACPPGQGPGMGGHRRDGRGCGPHARILIEAPRSRDPTLDVSPSRIHLCHGATAYANPKPETKSGGRQAGCRVLWFPAVVPCSRAVRESNLEAILAGAGASVVRRSVSG